MTMYGSERVNEWTENGTAWTPGMRVRYTNPEGSGTVGALGRITGIVVENYSDGGQEASLWVTWDGAPGADAHGAHDIEPA